MDSTIVVAIVPRNIILLRDFRRAPTRFNRKTTYRSFFTVFISKYSIHRCVFRAQHLYVCISYRRNETVQIEINGREQKSRVRLEKQQCRRRQYQLLSADLLSQRTLSSNHASDSTNCKLKEHFDDSSSFYQADIYAGNTFDEKRELV